MARRSRCSRSSASGLTSASSRPASARTAASRSLSACPPAGSAFPFAPARNFGPSGPLCGRAALPLAPALAASLSQTSWAAARAASGADLPAARCRSYAARHCGCNSPKRSRASPASFCATGSPAAACTVAVRHTSATSVRVASFSHEPSTRRASRSRSARTASPSRAAARLAASAARSRPATRSSSAALRWMPTAAKRATASLRVEMTPKNCIAFCLASSTGSSCCGCMILTPPVTGPAVCGGHCPLSGWALPPR
ncbi:hypothetical protein F6X68_32400 [Micromonospora sp. AMSO12t]|nr:hypothetical protein F6X68_32400 [Micromonospora sp. AMSO12t]